jgi:anti-anti-sigma factor
MKIKVDTKEKFQVLRPGEPELSVIMAEEIAKIVTRGFGTDAKNAIVDMTQVEEADEQALVELATLLQLCQRSKASFVFFGVRPRVKSAMQGLDLIDVFQLTPTESEAWDIVQMEEIERELFGDDPEDGSEDSNREDQ